MLTSATALAGLALAGTALLCVGIVLSEIAAGLASGTTTLPRLATLPRLLACAVLRQRTRLAVLPRLGTATLLVATGLARATAARRRIVLRKLLTTGITLPRSTAFARLATLATLAGLLARTVLSERASFTARRRVAEIFGARRRAGLAALLRGLLAVAGLASLRELRLIARSRLLTVRSLPGLVAALGVLAVLLKLASEVGEFGLCELERLRLVTEHGIGGAFDAAAELVQILRHSRLCRARAVIEATPEQLRAVAQIVARLGEILGLRAEQVVELVV